jgi:hypothetical protein
MAWHDLVHCRAQAEADRPRVVRLHAAIAEARGPEQRVLLNLALGKLLDDLASYADAYAAFDAANPARAASVPFDRAAAARRTSSILAAFPPELFARHVAAGAADDRPVLLIGMPGSGAAHLEHILARHPRMSIQRGPSPWPSLGERFLREGAAPAESFLCEAAHLWRTTAPAALRVIDPAPFAFRWAGLFHLVFPRGRIVHCRRNPIEACLAIFSSYTPPRAEFPSSQADLVFFYRQYLLLMQHWRRVLPPGRLLEVDYEALAADPAAQARRLIEFCGLDWDDACLHPDGGHAAARTASRWHARQPLRRAARWQNYAQWAGPLVQLLVPASPARRG